MASPTRISAAVREQVRQRAKYLCEYCHASERWQYVAFTMDHIVPLSQGGSSNADNLALACFPCNRRKSDRQRIVAPETGSMGGALYLVARWAFYYWPDSHRANNG